MRVFYLALILVACQFESTIMPAKTIDVQRNKIDTINLISRANFVLRMDFGILSATRCAAIDASIIVFIGSIITL